MEGNVNVRDLIGDEVEKDVESIDFTDALKEVETVNDSKFEENFGGNEMSGYVNEPVYTGEKKEVNSYAWGDGGDNASAFVKRDVVDADAAFRRIAMLKRTLIELKHNVNSTNCSNMDEVLAGAYENIEACFKNVIALETMAIEHGSVDRW